MTVEIEDRREQLLDFKRLHSFKRLMELHHEGGAAGSVTVVGVIDGYVLPTHTPLTCTP